MSAPSSKPRQPEAAAAARRRRSGGLGGWRPNELRGVWIGLGCTVLAHLALWLAAPHIESLMPVATDPAGRTFLIELTEDSFALPPAASEPAPEPPPPDRFVEVNPDAPANAPDETRNFGSQDQQLAQPEPTPSDESAQAPVSEGEATDPGAAIVSGSMAPRPLTPVPVSPPATRPDDAQSAPDDPARLREIPRPGPEAVSGENSDGVATTAGTEPGTAAAAIEGVPDGRPDGYALLRGLVKVDRNNPQARPTLQPESGTARRAPLLKNPIGTKNIGAIGYDAKWSDFGAYLQKLIETVQVQWERQIIMSRFYPVPGTKIVVTFVLDQAGRIDRIVKVEDSGDRFAAQLCASAITERAPYGEWSEDMVAVLGEEQEITFSFHYQ